MEHETLFGIPRAETHLAVHFLMNYFLEICFKHEQVTSHEQSIIGYQINMEIS